MKQIIHLGMGAFSSAWQPWHHCMRKTQQQHLFSHLGRESWVMVGRQHEDGCNMETNCIHNITYTQPLQCRSFGSCNHKHAQNTPTSELVSSSCLGSNTLPCILWSYSSIPVINTTRRDSSIRSRLAPLVTPTCLFCWGKVHVAAVDADTRR